MPKYRQLHTKIIDSFDFNEMPNDFTRVVWMLLTIVVDSEGRGIYNMAWIRSKMFPMRTDVETDQLLYAFEWFRDRSMIVVYEVGGKGYFYIPTFKTYQSGTEKEARSVLPSYIEEVRSNSVVTPEQVSVNADTMQIQYNAEAEAMTPRPNIFRVYEQEIGSLTPTIGDELLAAEKDYPEDWIVEAMKEATKHNARNWKYVLAILKRRKVDGRGSDQPKPTVSNEDREYVYENRIRGVIEYYKGQTLVKTEPIPGAQS